MSATSLKNPCEAVNSLDELEAAFVERDRAGGIKTVILSVQIPEATVRVLAPRLQGSGMSLSEFVRQLIGLKVTGTS